MGDAVPPRHAVRAGRCTQCRLTSPSTRTPKVVPQLRRAVPWSPVTSDVSLRRTCRHFPVNSRFYWPWFYLPRIRLQLTIDKQHQESVDLEAGVPPVSQEVNQERANFSALAVWDIARYYGIGGQLARFERTRDKKRLRLEARIVKLYEERRAIQLSLLRHPPVSAKGFMKAELRLEELTALLDSISDGYFTEARAKKLQENGAPK